MLDLIKLQLVSSIDNHRQRRDLLAKEAGFSVLSLVDPNKLQEYHPDIIREMAYVDAYTRALNFMEFTPADIDPAAPVYEQTKHILDHFLEAVPSWDPPVDELPDEPPELTPETFLYALYHWYKSKTAPPTPKFDGAVGPESPDDDPPLEVA